MYLLQPPWLYTKFLSSAVFSMADDNVYLTFDDGPEPEVTPQVLDILAAENVMATFFLLGKNAEQHPHLVERMRSEGHTIANHGYEHLDPWKANSVEVLNDAERGERITGSMCYRPPYGRLWPNQLRELKANGYAVYLWTHLSGDFDNSLQPEKVLRNAVDSARPGSVILMHDSLQAKSNVLESLPFIISELKAQGFSFGKL